MNRLYVRGAAGAIGALIFGGAVVVELHSGKLISGFSSQTPGPVTQAHASFPISLTDEQLASGTLGVVHVPYATNSEQGSTSIFSGSQLHSTPPGIYAEICAKLREFYKWLVDISSDVYQGVRPSIPSLIASQVIGYLVSKFKNLFTRSRNERRSLDQPMSGVQDDSADQEANDLATRLVQEATLPENEITVAAQATTSNNNQANDNAQADNTSNPFPRLIMSVLEAKIAKFETLVGDVTKLYKMVDTQQEEMKGIAKDIQSSVDINRANVDANTTVVREFGPLMDKIKDYPTMLNTIVGWQEKALKRIEQLERQVKVLTEISRGLLKEQKELRKVQEQEGGRSEHQEGSGIATTSASLNTTVNVGGELQDLTGLDNAHWLQTQVELLQKQRGELEETVRGLVVKFDLLQEKVAVYRDLDATEDEDLDGPSAPELFGMGTSSHDIDVEPDGSNIIRGGIGRIAQIHDRASPEAGRRLRTSRTERNNSGASNELKGKGKAKEEKKPFKSWFKSNILPNDPPSSTVAAQNPNQDRGRDEKFLTPSSTTESTLKLDFTPKLDLDLPTLKPKLRRAWLQQGRGIPTNNDGDRSSTTASTSPEPQPGPPANPPQPRGLFGTLSPEPSSNIANNPSPTPASTTKSPAISTPLFGHDPSTSPSPGTGTGTGATPTPTLTPSSSRPTAGAGVPAGATGTQTQTGYQHPHPPSLPTFSSPSFPSLYPTHPAPTFPAARPPPLPSNSGNPSQNKSHAFLKYLNLPSAFIRGGGGDSDSGDNPKPDSEARARDGASTAAVPRFGSGSGSGSGFGFGLGTGAGFGTSAEKDEQTEKIGKEKGKRKETERRNYKPATVTSDDEGDDDEKDADPSGATTAQSTSTEDPSSASTSTSITTGDTITGPITGAIDPAVDRPRFHPQNREQVQANANIDAQGDGDGGEGASVPKNKAKKKKRGKGKGKAK
ncbi:MAG: hypothetical protein Q9160_008344 [Pyrenula sp. 1 TL-2023]